MTQFKRGDKVKFTRDGAVIFGVIEDEGSSLMGVRAGPRYYAEKTVDLQKQTPAEEVGLKIGDTVVVGRGVICAHSFRVGATATFNRDDGTKQPRFTQDGDYQYLDLTEITIGGVPQSDETPCQKAGIAVGDLVELTNSLHVAALGKYVPLMLDDGTEMPRFGKTGNGLWIRLAEVRKLTGPKAGVLWKDAPIGATHYSLDVNHGSKWHKLDENGNWYYAVSDHNRNTAYVPYGDSAYAKVAKQVAIPGITVEVNPAKTLLEEFKVLDKQVTELTAQRAAKEAQINTAGFSVVDGILLPLLKLEVPSSQWKVGDVVIAQENSHDIHAGKRYTLVSVDEDGAYIGFQDSAGDMRRRNAQDYKLTHLPATEDLSLRPVSSWKQGDLVECLADGIDYRKGDVFALLCDCIDGHSIRFRDNVGSLRQRGDTRNFKLFRVRSK